MFKIKYKDMKKIAIRCIVLFVVIYSSINIYSQEINSAEREGDEATLSLNINKAIKAYKIALKESSDSNLRVKEKLANTMLFYDKNNKEAILLLEDMYKKRQLSSRSILKYAQILSANKNYSEAANVYNYFKDKGEDKITSEYFYNLTESKPSVKLRNIIEINTSLSDFSPMFYRKGITYVTTSQRRTGTGYDLKSSNYNSFTDVYVAEKTSGELLRKTRKLLKDIDQRYMQGPMSFSKDFGVMYLTKTNTNVTNSIDNKTFNLKIFRVNYKNDIDNWSEISEVKLIKDQKLDNYSYVHPAFSYDDQNLIFASNMPGGYGGTDLWMVKRVGLEWGTPENLGSNINTAGEEKFPYLSKDGTLYFASDGHPGLGGLDIFKSSVENNLFSVPENLGNPFNSKDDDFGYIIDSDNKEGYFTSNRAGGIGEDDIYHWKNIDLKLTIKVISKKTNEPIENAIISGDCIKDNVSNITDTKGIYKSDFKQSKVCTLTISKPGFLDKTLIINKLNDSKIINVDLEDDLVPTMKLQVLVLDKNTKQPISDVNVIVKQTSTNDEVGANTDKKGILKAGGIVSNQIYNITASKKNEDGSIYLSNLVTLNTNNKIPPDTLTLTIYLDKAEIGKIYKIENIYFDVSKWNIKSDAAIELKKIVKMLSENPLMEIEIGSHTDCRYSAASNEVLSNKRAASTVEYLVSKGIRRDRLKFKGYGETMPVNNCNCEGAVKSTCSDYEHQQNRRTEFKILKF
jgi:outer membrane protein OmpA-like peptidoglycan-associated protein